MKETELLLQVNGVHRSFGAETILRDVWLEVRRGSSISIMGPSGSGKTTLLGLLSLLLDPTQGEIFVQGENAGMLDDSRRSRLRHEFFGCVFQSAHLIGSLSVLDNVLVPALLSGQARSKRKEAKELLDRLGLSERAKHLPHMLSVGQKRRVSLVRALLMKPAIILADEPTNDLDPARANQVADFLLGLPSTGQALVLVTHDAALSDRAKNCFSLEQGQLQKI
jgi:putative ABC transport system ATP-binding protein